MTQHRLALVFRDDLRRRLSEASSRDDLLRSVVREARVWWPPARYQHSSRAAYRQVILAELQERDTSITRTDVERLASAIENRLDRRAAA